MSIESELPSTMLLLFCSWNKGCFVCLRLLHSSSVCLDPGQTSLPQSFATHLVSPTRSAAVGTEPTAPPEGGIEE